MNKVLNRPLFRKEALRKGYIKPIKAYDGRFIGPQPFNVPVPVGMPTGGPIPSNPRTQLMNIPQPAKQGMMRRGLGALTKYGFSIPFYIGSDLTYKALDAGESGKNLSTGAKLAGAGIGGALTAYGASRALPAAMGMGFLPGLAAVALYEGGNQLVRAGIRERKRIKAMSPAELAEFKKLNEGRALAGEADVDDSFFNVPVVAKKDLPDVKSKPIVKGEPGSGRVGFNRLNVAENKDPSENNLIDIDKVVKNNMPSGVAPVPPKQPEVKVVKIDEKIKEDPKEGKVTEKVTVASGEAPVVSKPGKVTAGDGTEVTDDVIQRAREIRAELMAGKSSQAKLVFLANLASGLMSGTTAKAGIGGALEVFGKALGPAVNNYVTIKLKENEMENEFMSDALELAADEFAAKNAVLESPEFQKYGIIQYSDENGNVRNITGGMLKNGSYVIAIPGAVDQNGMQQYQTVPVGSFDRFLDSDYAVKEQGQTLRNLSGKYKALNLGNTTIEILRQAEADDKKFGGPAGRLNLFTTRLGDAMSDLGLSMFGSKEEGLRQIEEMKDGFVADLMNDGMTEKEARKFLDNNFGKSDKIFQDTLKSLGVFRDETDAANLERLAINETVLTYALANSLKDKDRLTQKDIQMAKDLVNIFPLLRGQKQVIKSLEAVNETILSDIKRLENDYQFAFGGDSTTIDNYRKKYGVIESEAVISDVIPNIFKEQSTQELLENF